VKVSMSCYFTYKICKLPVVLNLLITIYITKRHHISEDRILVSPKGFQVSSPTAGKCIGDLFCFVLFCFDKSLRCTYVTGLKN